MFLLIILPWYNWSKFLKKEEKKKKFIPLSTSFRTTMETISYEMMRRYFFKSAANDDDCMWEKSSRHHSTVCYKETVNAWEKIALNFDEWVMRKILSKKVYTGLMWALSSLKHFITHFCCCELTEQKFCDNFCLLFLNIKINLFSHLAYLSHYHLVAEKISFMDFGIKVILSCSVNYTEEVKRCVQSAGVLYSFDEKFYFFNHENSI